MAAKSKIVISGVGAVTPIGNNASKYCDALDAGLCGISEITQFDTTELPIHHAAEVKDFNARDYLPTRLVMDLEPYMQYAYIAAEEAIKMSGLDVASSRVGVVMGSALCGISVISKTQSAYDAGKSAGPKFLLKAMGNIAASQLEINHQITGPSLTISTACSSGGDALSVASMLIASGAADAMIVMAGEAAICPTLIQSLNKTRALSKTGECKPFDIERNGFVLGEGGGAIILESAEAASARGANVLADFLGCANNNDAYNPTSPKPDGLGAAACIKLALEDAGICASDVDYINAHGTSTPAGDAAEAAAITSVFGEFDASASNEASGAGAAAASGTHASTSASAATPLVSSTKAMTGHLMGASGIIEAIACIHAVRTGRAPKNTGTLDADESLGLKLVNKNNCKQNINIALSNAMGFGGQNSCIIIGKHKE